ncbi:MAG: NAD-dependent succinate-semialdehyde dehydrogenase [Candidatus Omnitrophica bacterium]|nr:NAD-dependent succinate-semialdehyde dehydrogenase [Candidatus Omnitrophota bacterium]
MTTLRSINPTTGQQIAVYPALSLAESGYIIQATHHAFLEWRRTDFSARSNLLRGAAMVLRQKQTEYARLMAREMGKPVAQGRAEIEKCAWACEYYAEHGPRFLASKPVATDASRSFVTFQPLGVVLAVMPWNFPFWQVFRFAAPNLMAGNSAVLKHASNVSQCALAIEKVFRQAGFPESLFRTLLIGADQVPAVLSNPLVKAVTLTGSTPAGKAIAAQAGSLLKKSVLELGGSDPYVVLADADLEETVNTCVAARLINTGQSCIAAKRFIVVNSVRSNFEELFVRKMRDRSMGDPLEEGIDLGPLARHDLRDELHRQVQLSLEAKGRLLLGGAIPVGPGAFYPPTVLTDVKKGSPAFDEELFGPVAAIVPVKDEAEAIQAANDSNFGLGAAVFTRDTVRGERIAAEEIEAGCCFVNTFVKSDPRLPFGGIKESGYGRELAVFGLREFVNIKTIYVK